MDSGSPAVPGVAYRAQESFDDLAAVVCLDDRARRPGSHCTSPNDVASIVGCGDSASVHDEGARCYRADESIDLRDPWATCATAVAGVMQVFSGRLGLMWSSWPVKH